MEKSTSQPTISDVFNAIFIEHELSLSQFSEIKLSKDDCYESLSMFTMEDVGRNMPFYFLLNGEIERFCEQYDLKKKNVTIFSNSEWHEGHFSMCRIGYIPYHMRNTVRMKHPFNMELQMRVTLQGETEGYEAQETGRRVYHKYSREMVLLYKYNKQLPSPFSKHADGTMRNWFNNLPLRGITLECDTDDFYNEDGWCREEKHEHNHRDKEGGIININVEDQTPTGHTVDYFRLEEMPTEEEIITEMFKDIEKILPTRVKS